ncbi:MAG TPA: hypothetical protein VM733_02240, partial [Thermoanaerobaculia bacterium]|nr:hypothetical protein [Thermoanaerobaculia bacterium]
ERWTLQDIFEALGKDAARVMPELLRPTEFTITVPEYIVLGLRSIARRAGQDVSAFLTGELADLVEPQANALKTEIPGFGAALSFPDEE